MVSCELLEDGEQALFYKYNGKVCLKQGPCRIWLVRSKLMRLRCFIAKHDEYLRIEYINGQIEHRIGPCKMFLNSLEHLSVSVEKCFCLNANQAIIVYKQSGKDSDVKSVSGYSQRIICGPGIFYTQPDEWLHKFSWHGQDDNNKTRFVANKNQFEILNFAPNQIYYNVEEVRTSDDALIRIKLMIFYELTSIQTMLNETKDPIADLINCCCADVISFTSQRTYLNFIENCHLLNDLSEYKKLAERAEKIGFRVTKVVFRGYFASPKLQVIHDTSIQTRTKLKLQYESQMQEHEKLHLNLKNEMNRLTSEQNLELQKLLNTQELEKIKTENANYFKLKEFASQVESDKELKAKELKRQSENNNLQCEHLDKLKELGIDLTEYLLNSLATVEKRVQILKTAKNSNETNSSDFTNIHFHE